MDAILLRTLTPAVIGILVRRGADFTSAEDAVQDALVEALRVWPEDPPRDPRGWLVTVAWRKFLDVSRADRSRRLREERVVSEPPPGPAEMKYLHERDGDAVAAARLYAEAARSALNIPERDHLTRQVARLNAP